jgi:hypothetical protein
MAVNVILGTLSGMLYQFKFGFTWRDLLSKKPLKGRGLGSWVQPMRDLLSKKPLKRKRSWKLGSTDGRKGIWGR